MRTQISTRRCEATEEMRSGAAELAQRIAAEEPAAAMGKFMFDASGERPTVSAVFAIEDDESLVGHGESPDWVGALRELERGLLRQLIERREEGEEAGRAD